ncbi:LysM peptidoglycan-binding domain-containing protein [Streptomyces antarcticus]|uniref:LysM peptidoglycan-binding domain-containing protein n=1 Tax=Streptomyces antarcticus TaxID=2996458 RepID=UPI00226D6551|nr:LysM peptidoglycan-binding domain-containing protein [Streptomyces sp. H34-AA3]MCY0943488.1 LysM peptidoglycan-binding domain-containing protein [Streptomyces sp. H34-AA3]
MSQVTQVLSIAKNEVGYQAQRAPGERPSGHQKYSPEVPGLEWSNYQPWCATWTSWVAMKAGVASLFPRTASVWTAMEWFKQRSRWSEYPAIGAQVIYGTSGSTHTGLCYGYDSTYIYTYEGNTSLENSANGNKVMARKRLRRDSYVHGYGLPEYSEGIVTADPSKKGKAGFTYAAAASTPASGSGGSTGTPSGKYKVSKGQTLGAVAALLGVSLAALLAANPEIKNPDVVYPDQEINVPAKPTPSTPTEKPTVPPQKPEPSTPPAGGGTYTVAKGDSLSSIAARFGMSLAQLTSWNEGLAANPHLIYPGQKVKVQAGKHAATRTAAEESKTREYSRPSKPVAPAIQKPSQDDRLARIERELREVKNKLNEVSGKLDKVTPKPDPKPSEKPKPDVEVKPKEAKPDVPTPVHPEVSKPTDVPVVPQLVIPTPEVTHVP